MKRVLIDLDIGVAAVEVDGNDVEPAWPITEMMTHHEIVRQPHDPPLFLRRHGLGGITKRVVVPRLHLDEHQRGTIVRDDIDFASPTSVPPGNDCVPTALELPACEIFARFAEFDTGPRHAGPTQQL
jgi:hypothetical protein